MKHIEKIFNASTGETTIIERDFTESELAQIQAEQAATAARKAEAASKAATRQALLNKLGITEEEARLLLGGN